MSQGRRVIYLFIHSFMHLECDVKETKELIDATASPTQSILQHRLHLFWLIYLAVRQNVVVPHMF